MVFTRTRRLSTRLHYSLYNLKLSLFLWISSSKWTLSMFHVSSSTRNYKPGGSATRALPIDGSAKKLCGDTTVGSHPKTWTRDQRWKKCQRWGAGVAQMRGNPGVVSYIMQLMSAGATRRILLFYPEWVRG